MSREMLLAQFDGMIETAEDAEKLNAKLLDWAVRGKLVPQCSEEEPSTIMLERIRIKRKQLVREKKIARPMEVKPVDEDDAPFVLPPGWAWARLGELVSYMGSGSTPRGGKKVYQDEGVKFIRSQNVWNDGLYLDDVARIPESTNEKMSSTIVKPKDVLLNITGASIGRSALVPDDFDIGNVSQHVIIIRLIESELRSYIHKCIISSFFQETIMDVQVGISREGLSKTRLYQFLVPLPPLEEQKRIVAKVDALLAQTRQLAAELEQANTQRRKVFTSMTHHLTHANGAGPAATWPLLAANFDRLLTDAETMDELKQAILQLAVQGHLVPQDPNDEPASALLERIIADKKERAKSGEVRNTKKSPPIETERLPFKLPNSWIWVQLNDICYDTFYGPRFNKNEYVDSGVPTIRTTDMTDNGEIILKNAPTVEFPDDKR